MCLSCTGLTGCQLCCGSQSQRIVRGVRLKEFKSQYPLGHRHALPINNVLRSYGVTQKCCQLDFYNVRDENWEQEQLKKGSGSKTPVCIADTTKVEPCDGNMRCKNFMAAPNRMYSSVHDSSLFQEMKGSLNFIHCDYRRPQQHRRVTHAEHKAASDNRGASVFETLPGFDIETQVHFGPMHCLNGVYKQLFDILLGTKVAQTILFASNYGVFKDIVKDSKLPWELSSANMHKIDALMDCARVPSGTAEDLHPKDMFARSDKLQTKSKITILRYYLPYLISFTDLPMPYKVFYSMFTSDINDLCDKRIEIKSLVDLKNRLFESLSYMEGLFPLHYMKITVHQLVDIVDSIKGMGPIRCWWEFPGERMNAQLKQLLPSGGVSFERTGMMAMIESELIKMQRIYNSESLLLDTDLSRDTPHTAKLWDIVNGCCVFSPDKILLDKVERIPPSHVVQELDNIELGELFRVVSGRAIKGGVWDKLHLSYLRSKQESATKWIDAKMQYDDIDRNRLNDARLLVQTYKTIYKEGSRIQGRGVLFRETGSNKSPQLKANQFANKCWDGREFVSSLCLVSVNDGAGPKVGNLNAAWLLNFPDDPSVHGMALAFVTIRDCTWCSVPFVDGLLDPTRERNPRWPEKAIVDGQDSSYNSELRIVSVEDDLLPYTLAMFPFHTDGKPIRPSNFKVGKLSQENKIERHKYAHQHGEGVLGLKLLEFIIIEE